MACCCVGFLFSANAQMHPTSTTTSKGMTNLSDADYEHMLQANNEVAFRTYVINTLGLTEKQIMDFDPMYADYMKAKNDIAKKKSKLLNEYVEEVAENDSPKNEENDKEEFMEDYLELQVEESKLRKETFDRMEDKITADNAFGFFMIEDMVANDYYQTILARRFTPYIIITEDKSPAVHTMTPKTAAPTKSTSNKTMTVDRRYRADIDAFSKWANTEKGDIKDPHTYTRNGLTSLVAAIDALGMACSASTDQTFMANKNKIMQNNEKLGKNPSSNEHPDIMRESFIMAADMLKSVQQKCNKPSNSTAVMQLADAARRIDVSKTSMAQADVIRDFFKKAQVAVDGMANDISWSSN